MAILEPVFVPKIEDGRGFFDLRVGRTKMMWFFDVRGRRTKMGFFDFQFRRTKMGGFVLQLRGSKMGVLRFGAGRSKTRPHLRRTPPSSKNPCHLRRTRSLSSKNPPSSSKNPFFEEPSPFSIFGAEDRRTPYSRYSEPKIEEPNPPIFDLRPRRMVRRSDGRRRGVRLLRKWGVPSKIGGVLRYSGSEERRTPPIFDLRGLEERSTFNHFPCSRPEERRTFPHVLFLQTPPSLTNPRQVLSACLRFGSSARFSTLKIGPKIEIGSLFDQWTEAFVFL